VLIFLTKLHFPIVGFDYANAYVKLILLNISQALDDPNLQPKLEIDLNALRHPKKAQLDQYNAAKYISKPIVPSCADHLMKIMDCDFQAIIQSYRLNPYKELEDKDQHKIADCVLKSIMNIDPNYM
jgi:hypothetical protein